MFLHVVPRLRQREQNCLLNSGESRIISKDFLQVFRKLLLVVFEEKIIAGIEMD
jgi:hypothetical protein